MAKRWIIKDPNPQLQSELSHALNIHPILAQTMINRDIASPQEAVDFLNGDMTRLHDPFLFKDMAKAVDRLKEAVRREDRVLIYGDYDVDGVTSSVLLRRMLNQLGLEVEHYIPHRLKEGYGLNMNIAEYSRQRSIKLLIAVDCGITAFEAVEALNAMDIDVIIVDHHEPNPEKIPAAHAIINPKQEDCSYPFKGLASVGLVYKLAHALLGETLDDHLDLVALGTIADVAELRGENRILTREGLRRINTTRNLGLKALMDVARIKGKKITTHFVGFILGPRINASGRLTSARESLDLLLSHDESQAYLLAQKLEAINSERQKTQSTIATEALSIVSREVNFKEHQVIVVGAEGWHKGVLGIVASRILETYYRPVIVVSFIDGMGVGSARSVEGFHMFKALTHCADFLENFGGHKHAAGITIRRENFAQFREAINRYARDVINTEDLVPTLELDAAVRLSDLSVDLVRTMEQLEPFGEGNPQPLFCSQKLRLKTPPQVLSKDTLKFWVSDGRQTVSAVGFGMGKYRDLVAQTKELDLAFCPAIDDWNKEPTLQLKLKDIKLS